MKNWLTSNDDGVFAESGLIQRLNLWKRAADRASAARAPRNLNAEIEGLLRPFREQSAEIRSVVAVGEAGPLWLSGSFRGDDLHLVPVHALNEEFSYRAVAVLLPEESEHNWKLRRSLFDRGLVCIGSVDFAGVEALCFLASDAVRSFNQLDVASRGHVTMSGLIEGAGFGNQLWRYACVKLYALRHGLTPALPAWQGNQLFGLEDEACEGFDFPTIRYPGFADTDRELWDRDEPPINVDLDGYFQEIPECWQKHRALLRRMFQLLPEYLQAIDAWRDAVTDGGRRTLVAISVRRGDYSRFQSESWPWFRIVPEEWYLDWLRTIWPTLRDPVLFVASDEPDKIVPVFEEFEPIAATFGSIAQELPHHVSDFEVLRRADYLAICNSSFPRFAAILAPWTQKCFLPSFQTQSFVHYQPWMDPAFWPRFAYTWPRTILGSKPEQPAVMLPPGRFVPIGNGAPADLICVDGWCPPENSGIRPSQPTAVLRFRTNAPVGSRVHLVLQLAACGRGFRIRIYSESGPDTEVSAEEGSSRVAAFAAEVGAGKLVTIYLLTLGAMFAGYGTPDGSYWLLRGILYFDRQSELAGSAG